MSAPARFWPMESGRRITSPFGPRDDGFHTGCDFGWPGGSAGRPVFAVQSGTVIFAGAAQGYGGPDPAGWLVIDSTDAEGGGCLEYGHIVRDAEIRVGTHVTAGQRIGVINPDKRTNAGVDPHLHLADMPRGYAHNTKQDPLARLAGAREPGRLEDPMQPGPWTGDPVWLEEVLRDALGDRLIAYPGWETRGTGRGENGGSQMGPLWGVMIHHTGNSRERPEVIRDGVWQSKTYFLPGPLSQCLITPDGKCHLVAIGPCNHAGSGSYPGIPSGTGNTRLIGFECAWPTIRQGGGYDEKEPWPDDQIATMRDASAAVVGRLGQRGDRVIGHKEYAGATQGKWDPGNLDMPRFRGEVNKALDGEFAAPTTPPTETEGGFLMALSDKEQQELLINSREAVKLATEARDHAKWVRDQLGPNLWGPGSSMGKNSNGQELTLRDGLAAYISKAGA